MLRYGFLPVSRDAVLLLARMGDSRSVHGNSFPKWGTAVCFPDMFIFRFIQYLLVFHGVLLGCFRLRNQMTNL